MGYVKWSYPVLEHFCYDVFRAFGFSEKESKEIEDVLLTADLFGIESQVCSVWCGITKELKKVRFTQRKNRR